MAEFGVYLPEDALVLELMNMSERAQKVRADRHKAATNGQTYIP